MKTKRFLMPVVLGLGIWLMVMTLMMAWSEIRPVHAQEGDVEAATAAVSTTAAISNITVVAPNTSTGFISLRNGDLNDNIVFAKFQIRFPADLVQINADPEVGPGAPAGSSIFNVIRNNTTGQLDFDIRLGTGITSTGLASSTVAAPIASLIWTLKADADCGEETAATLTFFSVSVDTLNSATSGSLSSNQLTGGTIEVTCPQSIVELTLTSGQTSTIEVGQTTETEVRVGNVFNAGGIRFALRYNQAVVQVESVQPSGLLAGATPSINVANGVINFDGQSLNTFNTDGVVALIKWKGLAPGTSDLIFDDTVTRLLNSSGDPIENLAATNVDNIKLSTGALVPITVKALPRRIFFDPSPLAITTGHTQTQNVRISGITGTTPALNLNEIQFRVKFDPARVQVEDADANKPGVQISVGGLFGNLFGEVTNSVDNALGLIDYRVRATTPINTDGILASIRWRGVTTGSTTLAFDQIVLLNDLNAPITGVITETGVINVSGNGGGGGSGAISGVIEAQGRRPNFGGTQVSASVQPCASFVVSDTTTTSDNGSFSFSGTQTYQCLRASRTGYLVGQLSSPNGDIGTRILLAGDLNGDNKIDILDLARAAIVYKKPDPVADYNNNGEVDILDLALIAVNYNLTGPVELRRP